jgi:hypothetical protein
MRTPYPVGSVVSVERRHQELRREGDRITDIRAVREWIAAMKLAPRVRVERKSANDPALQRPGR